MCHIYIFMFYFAVILHVQVSADFIITSSFNSAFLQGAQTEAHVSGRKVLQKVSTFVAGS